MKQLTLIATLVWGLFGSPDLVRGQSLQLITSISYEQKNSGDLTTMDIHVSLLQPDTANYPCAAGSAVVADPLPLKNGDVTSLQGSAELNTADLTPQPEGEKGENAVYHLKVGPHLDLPPAWASFSLIVRAHCKGSVLSQQSPAIIVRRFATNNPLVVRIEGNQPQWNRSGNQDILSFTIKSSWPVSIRRLVIRDDSNNPDTHGNIVTLPYANDNIEASTHNVILKTTTSLQGSQQYKYDIQFSAGALDVTPAEPLPPINLPAQPTKDFVLVQSPTPEQLTVKNGGKDFIFTAQASDSGNLDVAFDVLKINGSSTLNSTTLADGLTHSFTIPKNLIPADGQYSFHFVGNRQVAPTTLADTHPSVLVVSTNAVLTGAIGLGLSSDSKAILVSYCLSQPSPNEVKIFTEQNSSFAGETGQSSIGAGGCDAGSSPYSATISLADFAAKLPSPPVGAAAPSGTATPSAAKPVPIQLRILDVSSTPRILQSLNLAAVLLTNQNSTNFINAVNKVTDKSSSSADKATATKTLTDTFKLDQPTIDALAQIGKKTNGAASTIGTVLAVLGKTVVSAYLGIPAAK
jgi:hypothetical protein